MRMKVPITGTVTNFNIDTAKLDGIGISGDPNDPVRLIDLDLGNVSWKLISIDTENDEAEIEITPSPVIEVGTLDNSYVRPSTTKEKQRFLDEAEAKVKNKTRDQLYTETGSKRLVKTSKHLVDYRKYKADIAEVNGVA